MIELINALHDIGITWNIVIKSVGLSRYEVNVDGEYFGIWDDHRKTFVD